jgi:hypothetical protein
LENAKPRSSLNKAALLGNGIQLFFASSVLLLVTGGVAYGLLASVARKNVMGTTWGVALSAWMCRMLVRRLQTVRGGSERSIKLGKG